MKLLREQKVFMDINGTQHSLKLAGIITPDEKKRTASCRTAVWVLHENLGVPTTDIVSCCYTKRIVTICDNAVAFWVDANGKRIEMQASEDLAVKFFVDTKLIERIVGRINSTMDPSLPYESLVSRYDYVTNVRPDSDK